MESLNAWFEACARAEGASDDAHCDRHRAQIAQNLAYNLTTHKLTGKVHSKFDRQTTDVWSESERKAAAQDLSAEAKRAAAAEAQNFASSVLNDITVRPTGEREAQIAFDAVAPRVVAPEGDISSKMKTFMSTTTMAITEKVVNQQRRGAWLRRG